MEIFRKKEYERRMMRRREIDWWLNCARETLGFRGRERGAVQVPIFSIRSSPLQERTKQVPIKC